MEHILVSGNDSKRPGQDCLIGVDHIPGCAAKIFTHLAVKRVSVNDIIQTEVSPRKQTSRLPSRRLIWMWPVRQSPTFATKFIESVLVREDVAEVSIVGVGMQSHYGVAEKMFSALAEKQINIDSITTSEIRISCLVDIEQGEKALVAVCDAFELDKPPAERHV